MKILCQYNPCGPAYVRTGWGQVFQALGHTFQFWRPEERAALDVFSEFEPDLFLGTTFDFNRALYKAVVSRPRLKVVLYASAWGDLVKDIDLTTYPIVAINDKEKTLLEKLKQETGQPDFVWLHYPDSWVDRTLGAWRSIGIEPVGLLNAADTFDYLDGDYRPELACDVGFIGGYWKYKAVNLDRYMLPLCHEDLGLKVKIFGNQNWPVAQYLGQCQNQTARDLFVSATVCPNVSEPHSTDFGFDVIERPFKVLSSGGFCVSDYVAGAVEVFGETIPFVNSPSDFTDLIRHFAKFPGERVPYMEKGYALVLKEHTYFNRVAKLFAQLAMPEEAAKTLALHKQLVLDPRGL